MQLVHERVAPPPAAELAGRRGGGGGGGMEIVTARVGGCGYGYEEEGGTRRQQRRRRKVSDGHVVAQLLDSPLPTPRRSCCGSLSAAGTPRSAARCGGGGSPGAPPSSPPLSPQRTHVPFSWESSPGVPKDAACGRKVVREVLPPRPPPGRGGGGGGSPAHAHARAYFGNATETTSSDDDDSDDTGREWSSLGWGTAILGTSKRYCAYARKARLATDGRGSPRVTGERRAGKPAAAASPRRSTSGEIPPLSPPSESWLSHARGSSTLSNKR
uniref:Uncharacterized protein n=1 Tax=Oryza barthii TaxID=65489 RepID=A0A0D3G8U1_9ORYZ